MPSRASTTSRPRAERTSAMAGSRQAWALRPRWELVREPLEVLPSAPALLSAPPLEISAPLQEAAGLAQRRWTCVETPLPGQQQGRDNRLLPLPASSAWEFPPVPGHQSLTE